MHFIPVNDMTKSASVIHVVVPELYATLFAI